MPAVSLGARAAARLRYALGRAVRLLNYGLDAVTLGALPDRYLDALTVDHYRRATSYRSDEHNGAGLFTWEAAALARHFPRRGRVLVTSAGGGREALALLEQGYEVVATECTAHLHEELARNLAPAAAAGTAVVRHAPPDEVPAEHGPYAAAIVGWGAYTHLIGRDRRLGLLRALAAALQPGAPLLISYLMRGDEPLRHERAIAALANALRTPLGRRPVELGETTVAGFAGRFYADGEVAAEVREAGLRVVAEHRRPYPHLVARRPAAGARSKPRRITASR